MFCWLRQNRLDLECYNRNNPFALVFCWIRLHPEGKSLGFCLIQQNTLLTKERTAVLMIREHSYDTQ